MIQVKRVYEPVSESDGERILVDRLWPRGLSKETARISVWLRDIAPTDELRKWYTHDEAKWAEFKKRYFSELSGKGDLIATIMERAKKGNVTLLFSSRAEKYNNAVALRAYIEEKRRGGEV